MFTFWESILALKPLQIGYCPQISKLKLEQNEMKSGQSADSKETANVP